ncbi:MAG: GNAT family N-acetyltransferase, partial [Flavobacteriaceae bacterium]|nr:GNAT family N-acetyltransferase [Flavobacteriaceae bacterium]
QLMTRKRQGLPTPSLGYYRSFSERMTGKLKLGLIEKEGTPVAGGMFFTNGKVSLYALGASDHRFFHLRPNDLLIWEMIKWLSLAGYREFDLGPTPHDGMGLLHFKRKWGGEEKFQRRYYFPWGPNIYRENGLPGRMLCGLFRHLPICVAKCVGSTVIKHIG